MAAKGSLRRILYVLTGVTFLLLAGGRAGWAAKEAKGPLQIYFIDVEGGQSTLFVTPDRHSLLVDTGWPANEGRDAERIVAAARLARLGKIETVLLTHYHDDHVGGVPQLLGRIQVDTFIDHGRNREQDGAVTQHGYDLYQQELATGKFRHLTAEAGEKLPIAGFDATVISADGKLIERPLPGAGGANQYCARSETRPADQTENGRSLGILLQFGAVKVLDLGDLTWDKEMELMCPVNKLGHVDLLVVSHHGWYQSSSPALIDAIAPRVAVMDNGATKGGSIPTLDTIHNAPGGNADGHMALWQLHVSQEGGEQHNSDPALIANLKGPAKGQLDEGFYLKADVERGGEISIYNSRTHETKQYPAQH